MEKFIRNAAILLLGFILQVALAPNISIGGVSPNFLLLAVIAAGMVNGPNSGAVIGFLSGLTLDMIGIGPIGLWALVFSALGYLTGLIDRNLYAEGGLLPITVIVITSVLTEFSYLVVSKMFGMSNPFFSSLLAHSLPTSLYTAFFGILLMPLLSRLMRSDSNPKMFDRVA